jgi:hypothetical protein
MRAIAVILLFLAAISPAVHAIGPMTSADVRIIPANVSKNADFVLTVDPHATASESVRVMWIVGGVEGAFGLLPKSGDAYVCHFSSSDPLSSCGPGPFRLPTAPDYPEQLIITSVSSSGQSFNITVPVQVGGIELGNEVNVDRNMVFMKAWPVQSSVGGISYDVYDANTLEKLTGRSGSLEYQPSMFTYTGSINLTNGEYFIAFQTSGSQDWGGTLSRVTVGSGPGSGTSIYNIEIASGTWRPVINSGQSKDLTLFGIKNYEAFNLTGLRAVVPADLRPYLNVTLPSALSPGATEYYTLTIHNLYNGIDITSAADLYANDTKIGEIPLDIEVTIINGTAPTNFCDTAPAGTFCNGGVCCRGQCLQGGECCSDLDCGQGETCSQSSQCVRTAGDCASGTCRQSCQTGERDTGTSCTLAGSLTGICCEAVSECASRADGSLCSDGVCCGGECVECCTDDDCSSGSCSLSYRCVSSTASCPSGSVCRSGCLSGESASGECSSGVCCSPADGGFDPTLLIVAGVVVAALVVVLLLLRSGKLRLKRKAGEEEEEVEEELF